MPKRKTRKKSDRIHHIIKYSSIAAIVLLLLSITAVAGYYFGFDAGKEHVIAKYESERQKLIDARKLKPKKDHKERLSALLKKHEVVKASHEYEKVPPKGPERKALKTVNKPKLAIIIDDVSFQHDVDAIKALKIPLTMSFLPPNDRHPDSAKLAAKEPFYMVHLPLEALRFNAEEHHTLYVKDSQEHIMKRISEIKKIFPKVAFINNHTGSKFTSNEMAMNRLMFALRKEKMIFVDSRTTAETKVPRVMKNYGLPYIARDVFLDHVSDVKEIKRQLKRAVDIAKRSGKAIAIGHPRRDTLQALRESEQLLDQVDLVGINEYI